MKPTKEIIGLRIINISDGTQVGVVKDIVINPQGKSMDFLIFGQAADYFGAKVIAFMDILGLGEFAVTILHPGVIQDVTQNKEAQALLNQDTRVIGTKVLTKKGQLIGEVKEILIDEETGHIAACLFESNGQMHEVGVDQVITLGKELLIVEGEPNHRSAEPSSEKRILSQNETPDFIEEVDSSGTVCFEEVVDVAGVVDFTEDDSVEEVDFAKKVNVEEVDYSEEKESGFNIFEQRQLEYFIGKRVEEDILLDNNKILRAGECITPEIVTQITSRRTLMEVTSHLQKNKES